jgi:CHAT domain-containing protein
VWTVDDGTVQLVRRHVDGTRLDALVDRVASLLELRRPEPEVRPLLGALYDVLVGPVEATLAPDAAEGRPLVLVADGEFATVPFAALYDAARGRYLVQRHRIRFVASLAEGDAGPPRDDGAEGREALVVADPAFDAGAHPGLARLPGAEAEASAVASIYGGSRSLVGEAARAPAVAEAMAHARVVHYAGHAVFDDARPERSFLLLAGPDGPAGRLAADEIARMRLGGTRLIVLSACRTIGGARTALSGLTGLAGAFRASGAAGVVGSSWRVDDELTRPLMVELHREFARSADGAAALRAAQLRMLASDVAALRSPAAWSAFRYLGS